MAKKTEVNTQTAKKAFELKGEDDDSFGKTSARNVDKWTEEICKTFVASKTECRRTYARINIQWRGRRNHPVDIAERVLDCSSG